jgi:hypothetical protein
MRPPRPLEIASAVEDCKARNDQAEKILLHDSRQCEDPRIPRHRTARHNCEPRHSIAHAYDGLLDLLHPICVRPQCKVDQREEDNGGEYAPREGGQIDAGHTVQMVWSGGGEGIARTDERSSDGLPCGEVASFRDVRLVVRSPGGNLQPQPSSTPTSHAQGRPEQYPIQPFSHSA